MRCNQKTKKNEIEWKSGVNVIKLNLRTVITSKMQIFGLHFFCYISLVFDEFF